MTDSNETRDLYRKFCKVERSVPIFSQPWWLDVTAGPENWDVVLVLNGDSVEAALPFCVQRRLGLKILTTPALTPSLGPWLKPHTAKETKMIAREKRLLTALFEKLPEFDIYQQNWSVDRQNWQPLYWMGYEQTTAYTHRLTNLSDANAIWTAMDQNTRNDIRKARDRNGVVIRPADSTVELVGICNKTFDRQNLPVPYSIELLERVVEAASQRNAMDLLVAEGPDRNLHAGAMILYDSNVAYYVMGGGDPELRNSCAASLIMWEAIAASVDKVRIFDFEGSMIESVERFFRGYGGELTPYLNVRKVNSLRGRALLLAQGLKRRKVQTRGREG